MDPSFADYRNYLRADVIGRIRRLMPGIQVGIYEHMFYNWPQANPRQYEDSWIINASGKPHIETWRNRYSRSIGVYPTTANSFGAAFRKALLAQQQEFRVEGFYFDETNYPGRIGDPITYGAWDRRSAILDPGTFAIRRKIGYFGLLSADYKRKLFSDLRRSGLWLLGNDQPYLFSENRDNWPRFTETDNLPNAYRAHLYTPLAFSYGFERYTVQDLRDRLNLGVIYCVTGPNDRLGIVHKFFPITPLEIHSGWIQGRERIIIIRSGKFGWTDGAYRARLWRYDAAGKLVEDDPPWREGTGLAAISVPDGGIAILEREMPAAAP
jgi:hypothetical protein